MNFNNSNNEKKRKIKRSKKNFYLKNGGIDSIKVKMLSEMNLATQVQILENLICISHSADILRKDMNSTIFTSAMNK